MGDNTKEGENRSTQMDSLSEKIQDVELSESTPMTLKLLQNLTEIQLVKKNGKGKEYKPQTIEETDTVDMEDEMIVSTHEDNLNMEIIGNDLTALVPDNSVNPTDTDLLTQTDNIENGSSEELYVILNIEQSNTGAKILILSCNEDVARACVQCSMTKKPNYKITYNNNSYYICNDACLKAYKCIMENKAALAEYGLFNSQESVSVNKQTDLGKFIAHKKCGECEKSVLDEEYSLAWEMMGFCNEFCLSEYQKSIGTHCTRCQSLVNYSALGKYCVRFGYNIKQFCNNFCLEEFKKGLKLCTYCQRDISMDDVFLAPSVIKGQFKDFCSNICIGMHEALCNNRIYLDSPTKICDVCGVDKEVQIEYVQGNKINSFCGEPCFVTFKFVNNVTPEKCVSCQKHFDIKVFNDYSAFVNDVYQNICSKSCLNIYITLHRKIVCCNWCRVRKYDFDMILKSGADGKIVRLCSLTCLTSYQLLLYQDKNYINCHYCNSKTQALFHIKMTNGSNISFCSYICVMDFRRKIDGKISRPVIKTASDEPVIPIITHVQSLATIDEPTKAGKKSWKKKKLNSQFVVPALSPPIPTTDTLVKHQIIIKAPLPPPQRNVATMCKVTTATQEASCVLEEESIGVQTDDITEKVTIVPIPVPLYIPAPVGTYATPFPVPFSFTFPIPIPVLIPTTKNSSKRIMNETKTIQVETPSDPLEAELLTIAEMVAANKKDEHSDLESDGKMDTELATESAASPESVGAKALYIEDTMEIQEPEAQLEDNDTADADGIISTPSKDVVTEEEQFDETLTIVEEDDPNKGRKRITRSSGRRGRRGRKAASQKNVSSPFTSPASASALATSNSSEKPDANMRLKFTFGVNAWKHWVALRNSKIERSSRAKLLKSEILQLTADELNYSLCLFVKEVRKPNGQEYAPDTIYYLCLGIQQYLLDNARMDNIFCDSYYEKFTDCLDEITRKFSVLYNDANYIVTRVEEEHLWESKQLGAHSPRVLLSTLMFLNTKYFNLSSVEEHMRVSFSHIMKHWKRNPNQAGAKVPGSRNVLLRFYPPTSMDNRKKVYEQHENEENPLRCPVKLYEFYLSKCPGSVKTRNDVYYLLPERSCVPDSPVWYSTEAFPQKALEKMLHRVKMVKEVNVALLTNMM